MQGGIVKDAPEAGGVGWTIDLLKLLTDGTVSCFCTKLSLCKWVFYY